MKTFKDLVFKPHSVGNGVQAGMDFDNNYGISVVKFRGSYGFKQDLWEVAVMYKGELTYSTPVTCDVLGHQSDEDVTSVMKQIQELKE
jgi:hypothetical protein